jgi:CobQ-like glutamine amidotransferase family enzyme
MNDCKKIKLLHLFPKLFSLYGEYGNIRIIEKELASHGYEVAVSYFEGYGDSAPDLSEIDFIYVGSGCEKDIKTAVSRLSVIKEGLSEYIASGKVMLASGNSMSLFGKSVTVGKEDTIDALGIFDYTSTLFTDKRFLGDVLSKESDIFGAPVIGFINNSMVIDNSPTPIF